ncbi:MAG TPA: extracellular solute-binding protein, partial [Dehalococcoidia bacterium]|nr:extracellular solute-binding protein [Dehalococcoidia bacterium]
YGITVDFFAGSGSELAPRIRTERQAGQYLWDVYVGGISTMVNTLKPMGALDPLVPAMILPEVKEPGNWRGGDLPFADRDRMAFMFSMSTTDALKINTNLVKAEEFKSYRDLLDPKWKGKIVAQDPREAANQAELQFYYAQKELGADFIRALAKQDLILVRDDRTSLDWLAQGRYPILIGGSTSRALEMSKEGLPVQIVDPKQMKEGGYITAGPGGLGLVNKAPHPNAAKLYINWLLSKEAQTDFSKASVRVSRRADVPTDHVDTFRLPKEGFINLDTEERLAERDKVIVPLIKEIFGE